ncbi:MAG: di-trans,poly-cis-decaprenylcistransferase [Chloroflexi bacterium]|nr:di-trans,poly-cis-decaprenylcistransferase [Chloroflexota bacterium]
MADNQPTFSRVPHHVAIIMDGNGRWAQQRGRIRLEGHRAGTENIRGVLEACAEFGIQTLTLYSFSTENWSRPSDEVQGLLGILEMMLKREVNDLHKNGVRLWHIGRLEGLAPNLQEQVKAAIALTRNNTRITLNVAFNYGGRTEIVDAVRRIMAAGIPLEQISEETISSHLYTAGQADPDLVIRTAGEMRLSNFLIWQAAYAEFYSTPTYWPDFNRAELIRALEAFDQRVRKFGKTQEQILAGAPAEPVNRKL